MDSLPLAKSTSIIVPIVYFTAPFDSGMSVVMEYQPELHTFELPLFADQ